MNVSNLLSNDAPRPYRSQHTSEGVQQDQQRSHQYPTRHSVSTSNYGGADTSLSAPLSRANYSGTYQDAPLPGYDASPPSPAPKTVTFELVFDGASHARARLPLKVQIFPHDTTDSIVTTVKNFYGLYEGTASGFSFEDRQGNILIARYENFRNDMSVLVRVMVDHTPPYYDQGQTPYQSASPRSRHRTPQLGEPFQMPPPNQVLNYNQPYSRPSSRVARKRSPSPRSTGGGRSLSIQKGRSRPGIKSRDASMHGSFEDTNNDAANGYSSSDNGAGSISGSRKARSEQFASAEISLENVVEGGRRKRAKFESSELPLFVPPQIPAANSISSISPQRRSNGQDNPSPFARPIQRTSSYGQTLQSPQSYGYNEHLHNIIPSNGSPYSMPAPTQHGHRLRDRTSLPHSTRSSTGSMPRKQGFGILPTPDPTIASCISDEDVALQLMRLGDASNISHGRTSASTLDETLSGRADIASSAGSESDEEGDEIDQAPLPLHQHQHQPDGRPAQSIVMSGANRSYKQFKEGLPSTDSAEPSGDEVDGDYYYDHKRDGVFKSDPDDLVNEFGQPATSRVPTKGGPTGMQKVRSGSAPKKTSKSGKQRPNPPKKLKTSSLSNASKAPMSPTSLASQSRKNSIASTLNFQHHLGADEEDLSSKPRCQRCRKSKKGCDRQRPCQRCKDAGIGPEGCISEDEGNGRKGRFGRHMGVSVKKDGLETPVDDSEVAGAILTDMAASPEKSKKRKR